MGTYISELATHTIKGDLAFGISSWGLGVHIILLPIFGAIADVIGQSVDPHSFSLDWALCCAAPHVAEPPPLPRSLWQAGPR